MYRRSNKLLLVLLVLVFCAIGFGFYRGWFALSRTSPETGSNKVNINLTVDPDQVQADAETVKEKTTELTTPAPEKADAPAEQAKDSK